MLRKLAFLTIVVMILGTTLPMATPTYAQTPEEWFAQAGEPYQGVTIKGVSERTAPSQFMLNSMVPGFTEATGINVEFELTSWDEMYEKEIKDMESGAGIYDFVYIEQDFIFAALEKNWLTDLTQLTADNPDLLYPGNDVGDFTTFAENFVGEDGHLYGFPFEAFIKSYIYRTDLFEDPEIQAAFKELYGWDLRAAVNWDEYLQIAEFFTIWGQENNLELWGSTVTAAAHPATAYEMIESIWPAWGVYYWGLNPETLKATSANGGTLDGPRAKEALAYWVSMLDNAPPEARTSTWDEVAASFGAGRTAQGMVYLENIGWIAQDEDRSLVTGKVGVAVPPLYPGVLNDAALLEGYIGYYDGGALGIPHSSKEKEAAFLWLQWMARKDLQGEFATSAGRVVRNSTFDDPLLVEADPAVGGYFTLLATAGPLFFGAPPFPFHRSLFEIYLLNITKAMTGELTAEEACDAMAQQVDEKLAELGYTE